MNILFLCTANLNRSRTAEDFYHSNSPKHQFKSAGLSQKYCQKYGTNLCTIELLEWSDKIFVMEEMHVQRIAEHGGGSYLNKIEVLNIDDIYQYMQPELIEKLTSNEKLLFLSTQLITESYQVTIGKNNQIPIPENICMELGINLGDILICKLAENATQIQMTKHEDQTLSDAEIASAGNLTRIISYIPD